VSAPLSDIRVLDLTRLLPGGFCSLLLADLGAEVLKVEDTGMGDYIRWAPPYYEGEEPRKLGTASSLYLSLNRGKRSVRLDLKSETGREAFLRLVSTYDVVLDGFRPGVLERLGVGYERLREANPGIVVCAITGYGQDGPNTQRAGHDINYLALVGLLGLSGADDGPPVSSAGQIADVNGGLMAAIGVLAALNERRRSGEGQLVDISMADGALSWLALVAGRYLCDREVPQRGEGQLSGGILCYLPYEVADGWVACGALEPKFWAAFCEGVGRPDLIELQFEAPGSPGWRQVAEIFRGRTREEWRAFNDANDCCIEPILEMDEALESELVRAREMVVEVDQPGIGPVSLLGLPVKLGRTPGDPTRPAPAFGEHTAEVLREAGYAEEEVRAMLESGAAAGPESAGTEAEFRA
jgi:crotonobetainyl-CoA:carnitine CoA-transferase CaiB-like acyl-CoA transferase